MSPRYFLYVILALFVSGVHTALSTTSLATDYFLTTSFSTCSSSAEFSQTTWASNPTAWASNPKPWASNPTTWATHPTTWASNPTTWATHPTTWASNPTTWPTHTTTWASNLTTWPTNSTTWRPANPTTTTNPTTTSGTPTVTLCTTSTSPSATIRLGNCPPNSLSTINSGSGLSSVSNMCGFDADSNIYGLGNRLGIYLQWIGSLITYQFLREETYSIGAANFIFQLSNFVSLLYITSKKSEDGGGTYAVECWIVLLICTGAVFPGVILSPNYKEEEENKKLKSLRAEKAGVQSDTTRPFNQLPSQGVPADPSTSKAAMQIASSDRDRLIPGQPQDSPELEPDPNPAKVSVWGEVFQAVLSTATQLFAVWFVFQGMDEMFAPVNSRSAFAFAKVNIYHRFRTFLQFFFVFTAVLTLIWTGLIFWGLFLPPGERKARRDPPTISPARLGIIGVVANALFNGASVLLVVIQMMKGRTGPEAYDRIVSCLQIWVVWLLLLWIIFIILSIELIIPWNHIMGAYSFDSGQWIILVASICALVRVVWLLRKLRRLPHDDPRRIKGLRNSLVDAKLGKERAEAHGFFSGLSSNISGIPDVVRALLAGGDNRRRLPSNQEP